MRESGILMHITSLPGRWGVGTMGREAFRFVDFLKASGQVVCLIKPQFEAGKEKVGKKGVVREPETHKEVLDGFVIG